MWATWWVTRCCKLLHGSLSCEAHSSNQTHCSHPATPLCAGRAQLTMSTACCEVMNSHTPSEASTTNWCAGLSWVMVTSGSATTPMLSAAAAAGVQRGSAASLPEPTHCAAVLLRAMHAAASQPCRCWHSPIQRRDSNDLAAAHSPWSPMLRVKAVPGYMPMGDQRRGGSPSQSASFVQQAMPGSFSPSS